MPDPKEVVGAAKQNFTNVQKEFDRVYYQLRVGAFEGAPADAVDVLSMPVVMIQDAIDSMKEVKDLAQKVNDENKKNLILKIIEGILFLVPYGELIPGPLAKIVDADLPRVHLLPQGLNYRCNFGRLARIARDTCEARLAEGVGLALQSAQLARVLFQMDEEGADFPR